MVFFLIRFDGVNEGNAGAWMGAINGEAVTMTILDKRQRDLARETTKMTGG
jgi:hypothetical protein